MNDQPTYRKSIPISGVQARLGVSRRTVYNWIGANKIPYFRTPGGAIRIYEDDVLPPAEVLSDVNA